MSLALLTSALFAGAIRELSRSSPSVMPLIVQLAAVDAALNSFIYFPAIPAAVLAEPRRSGCGGDATAQPAGKNQKEAVDGR